MDSQHETANERLIHAHLLKKSRRISLFHSLKNEALQTPKQGYALTEQALKVLPNELDMVVLGMGTWMATPFRGFRMRPA